MTDDDASNPSPYRRGSDDDYWLEYSYECDGERLYKFLPIAAVAVVWTCLRAWHVCLYFQASCNADAMMDERFYLIRGMHIVSVVAGAVCSSALLFNPLNTAVTGDPAANTFKHWITRYVLYALAWLFYDLWLILRDRSLQSVYYQTPPLSIIPLLAMTGFVTVGTYWMSLPLLAAAQVIILWYATWLFVRPFRKISSFAEMSPTFKDVIWRTGLGAAVHAALLAAQISLFAYLYTNECVDDYDDDKGGCILKCRNFIATTPIQYVGGLVFTMHMGISHRDDILVWRIYQKFTTPHDATANSLPALPSRKSSTQARMNSSSVHLRSTTLEAVAQMSWEESSGGNILNGRDSSQAPGEKGEEVELGQSSASPSNGAVVHNPISS